MLVRGLALAIWGYLTWILLSWTATVEQLAFGAVLAVAAATACLPLGDVARPWKVLRPRRLFRLLRVGGYVLVHMVRANVALSRRIWSPSRPLRSGMVVVDTEARSDGALTAVGVLSSLIVDNQIIDVDRRRHQLLYHGVSVTPASPSRHREQITGSLEDLIRPLEHGPGEGR